MKLVLLFVGAPLALASQPLGQPWLFYLGLALVVGALILPSRAGQTFADRVANLRRHLPAARWLDRGRGKLNDE